MLRLGWPNYAATRVDQLCCGSNGLVKVRINRFEAAGVGVKSDVARESKSLPIVATFIFDER